jgi:hypothetical protein
MTIDRLKQVIYGLNNESAPGGLAKTGRKQDLIDRVRGALARLKEDRDVERWTRARTIMYQVKTSGMCVCPPCRVYSARLTYRFPWSPGTRRRSRRRIRTTPRRRRAGRTATTP